MARWRRVARQNASERVWKVGAAALVGTVLYLREEFLASCGPASSYRGGAQEAFAGVAGVGRIPPAIQARKNARGGALVAMHAEELPVVEDEPDMQEVGREVTKIFRENSGLNQEAVMTAEDRVTPIDRWLGFDRGLYSSDFQTYGDFVDSSDESSYVTVTLEKPLGIEFMENAPEDGGGVYVGEVRPGYSAYSNDFIRGGYHLIMADNKPVYGLPFDDAIEPIVDAEGAVKLTFFTGETQYFYGEHKPSKAWLDDFIERLRSGSLDDEQ
eukprot:TRINITY_DN58804_c0_g1_i1.p1 TRINITY_DN58804_c0_g1~~TRINITY_DN58804_c0_g1_i1.p1  ORF type:complete len:270 (-),score=55.01 TRINITY_DN58804_c0_g1_i1:102-911(-)